MTYTEFLEKLGNTALAYAKDPNAAVSGAPLEDVGISGDVDKDMDFDGNGNWTYSLSQYCPLNVDVKATVQSAPEGAVFNITIDTNYPAHMNWDGVRPGQTIETTIKTNTFSSTKINIKVHSNQPNSKASFHLHYSV